MRFFVPITSGTTKLNQRYKPSWVGRDTITTRSSPPQKHMTWPSGSYMEHSRVVAIVHARSMPRDCHDRHGCLSIFND